MILHPEELDLARAYSGAQTFEGLTAAQLQQIRERARTLQRWTRTHPLTHSAISVSVIVLLFAVDYAVLLWLPRLFLPSGATTAMIVLAGIVVGCVHSYVMYSLAFFTMHDGYAHKVLFPMTTRLGRAAHTVGSNLCRVASAEPEYFARYHVPHHLKFGTEEDGEFLNFVMPRRFWRSLLPLAAILSFNDFVIHRPPSYTRSRVISAVVAIGYLGIYAVLISRAFGPLLAFIVVALAPHAGFYVDRLRQFTEHNLMPLENENGARSLGLGFWGLLLGGGPWGSPCHLEHHLAIGLPWYGQLLLHGHLRTLLTPRQRAQFFLQPVIGWPSLLWQILRTSAAFRRHATADPTAGAPH